MAPLSVAPGEVVIQQGATGGDTFYVVAAGSFQVEVNGTVVATRTVGGSFGELALLYACPRAATVRCAPGAQAKLWVLHQKWFRLLLRTAAEQRIQEKARSTGHSRSRTCLTLTPPGEPPASGELLQGPGPGAAGQGGRHLRSSIV